MGRAPAWGETERTPCTRGMPKAVFWPPCSYPIVSNSLTIPHANVEPSSHHRSHSLGSVQQLWIWAERKVGRQASLTLSSVNKQKDRQSANVRIIQVYTLRRDTGFGKGKEDLPQH